MTEDERAELMGACCQALDRVLNRGKVNACWILLTEWRPEEGDTEQKSGLAINLPRDDAIEAMQAAIAMLEQAIERLQSGPLRGQGAR